MLEKVKALLSRVSLSMFGMDFTIRIEYDNEYTKDNIGRVFIQIQYKAICNKTGQLETWSGGKHYLSQYMTDDEIIKKAYAAFESSVKHEILEGFKVDNVTLFNPHVNFEELLKISHLEVGRTDSRLLNETELSNT